MYISFSQSLRPSTVIILRPSSLSVSGTQALQVTPSIITVQAPQAPSLHPSLTEVRPRSSLRKRRSFLFFSAVTVCPFTTNVDISVSFLFFSYFLFIS